MRGKSTVEKSEEEIQSLLENQFGKENIEKDPKVGDKKADFRVKNIDAYVEVHTIKDILSDQWDIVLKEGDLTLVELKDDGQKKILDRIANKLLYECTQLPEGKRNLVVTKTEDASLYPEEVIDAIIGQTYVQINRENMQPSVRRGATGFRTEEERQKVLGKVSAIIVYKSICQHHKLSGTLGNNQRNAKVPFDEETLTIFLKFLCDKCKP